MRTAVAWTGICSTGAHYVTGLMVISRVGRSSKAGSIYFRVLDETFK
jgi:hypothetical protein